MKTDMQQLRRIALMFPAMLLSACSFVPTTELVHIYKLPVSTVAGVAPTEKRDWSLRINTPHASQQLDNSRIVVIPADNQISSYKGARWSERAPILLRDRIFDTFQSDGRIKTITNDSNTFNVDMELTSDLRAFQSEYRNGKPGVRIQLDMYLVEGNNQRVLASHRFEVHTASNDADVESVIQAFGQASDSLSREIVDWAIHARTLLRR